MTAVRIVGVGKTAIGKLGMDSTALAFESLQLALLDANMKAIDLGGLFATPSLSSPHFMQGHYLATKCGLFQENPKLLVRTVDTGGAGPISAIASAVDAIRRGWAWNVAVVSSDAVYTLPSAVFAERSNSSIPSEDLPEPHIPHGYDRYAQWYIQQYGLKREQLAMVPALMSAMAARHPDAMCRRPYSLQQILEARAIAPFTTLLECARRGDGAVTLIVSAEDHYKQKFAATPHWAGKPRILGMGEASGPLYPPPLDQIHVEGFSCRRAVQLAYREANATVKDIGFFGLYDCFPICFIQALESVGLCPEGKGGEFVEAAYRKMVQDGGVLSPNQFPINTHGGLMCHGAPWEVPAMYNVTEAIAQMAGKAGDLQIHPRPRMTLSYGNGGILSGSSVMILGVE